MSEWTWWQDFANWLGQRFDELRAALNPVALVIAFAEQVASWLPESSGWLESVTVQARLALRSLLWYVSMADYVINLPVLLGVCAGMLAIEAVLVVSRVWRFVRSHVV